MTELGGATSHTVLLAKSLGIPAVVGLKNLTGSLKSGDRVILNGYTGEVIVNPDQQALEYNSKRLEEEKQLQAEFERLKDSRNKNPGRHTNQSVRQYRQAAGFKSGGEYAL